MKRMEKRAMNHFTIGKEVENTVDFFNSNKRLTGLILADTSGSMHGKEALLSSATADLYKAILSDNVAKNCTELGVISFNSDIYVHEKIREISLQERQGKDITFECQGVTLTGLALQNAIYQLQGRIKAYGDARPIVPYYPPILFVLSDGKPECYDPAVLVEEEEAMKFSLKYIHDEVSKNRLVVIAVEIGDHCDHELMRQITGLPNFKHVIKVDSNHELTDFFKLTSSILIASSHTGNTTLNEMGIQEMEKMAAGY